MSDHVLVCPHCYCLNNVIQEDFISHPECSECKALLLPKTPIDVNEEQFKRFLTHSTLPIVVNFWGTWSGVSLEMTNTLVSLTHTFLGDALFVNVNSEQEQVLANNYKVVNIPTFILFISGAEYRRLQGSNSEREFHGWLERYLRIKRKKAIQHPSSV